MIRIYITHHVTAALDGINDILIDQIHRMMDDGDGDGIMSTLHVAYWTDDPTYAFDLGQRMPDGVELILNDRSGRPDTQPSLRNKIVTHARASGCEAFVLLHNDVRPARGWLTQIVDDWRQAEATWGENSSIVSPRYVPYHMTLPKAEAVRSDAFWSQMRSNPNVLTVDGMRMWCAPWRFPFVRGEVHCPLLQSGDARTVDDGHQLMMFISGRRFFDDVGLCDERYTGINYDDCDWGMRALLAGKRSLHSTTALMGHIAGLSFGLSARTPAWSARAADNAKVFVELWGQEVFDELQSGKIWPRLHKAQQDPRAANSSQRRTLSEAKAPE